MAASGAGQLSRLPPPFKTVIPNAASIAEATEETAQPRSFRQKYTPEFAGLFEALCREVVERTERQRQHQPEPLLDGAKV